MLLGWLYREFDDLIVIMSSFVEANSQSICYQKMLSNHVIHILSSMLSGMLYTQYLVMPSIMLPNIILSMLCKCY